MYRMQKTVLSVAFCRICIAIVFWLEAEKRFVSLRVSSKGMRIIDKKGIDVIVAELRGRGETV